MAGDVKISDLAHFSGKLLSDVFPFSGGVPFSTYSWTVREFLNLGVSGLTGGGLANLDGWVTAKEDVGQFWNVQAADNLLMPYQLQAGTAAQSLPNVVRPLDFDAANNPKFFQLLGFKGQRLVTTGVGGAGYVELLGQSGSPSLPSAALRLYSDSSDRPAWIQPDGFTRTFSGAPTDNRVYTLPDASGSVVLNDNAAALTNKTYSGLTVTTTAGTLTVAGAKTLTVAKSLTLDGTDGTTMTFPTTSAVVARTDAGQTFTGTQAFGAVTATTFNGNTFTAGTGALTISASKTLTVSSTLTLAGTDGTTMTFPTTSATLARTDAGNTFTGHQTIEGVTSTGATGTGNLVYSITPTLTGSPVIGGVTFSGSAATSLNSITAAASTDLTLAAGTSAALGIVSTNNFNARLGAGFVAYVSNNAQSSTFRHGGIGRTIIQNDTGDVQFVPTTSGVIINGSNNPAAAALDVYGTIGGVGLYVRATTAATSTTTGSLVNAGGFGNAGKGYFGDTLHEVGAGSNPTLLVNASSAEYGVVTEDTSTSNAAYSKVLFATNRSGVRQIAAGIGGLMTALHTGQMDLAVNSSATNSYLSDIVATFYGLSDSLGVQFFNTAEATTGGNASVKAFGGFYAAKAIVSASATSSTSTATGSGIFGGGVGVAQNLWVGGTGNFSGRVNATLNGGSGGQNFLASSNGNGTGEPWGYVLGANASGYGGAFFNWIPADATWPNMTTLQSDTWLALRGGANAGGTQRLSGFLGTTEVWRSSTGTLSTGGHTVYYTTSSTSTGTGSLINSGGFGNAGTMWVGGVATFNGGNSAVSINNPNSSGLTAAVSVGISDNLTTTVLGFGQQGYNGILSGYSRASDGLIVWAFGQQGQFDFRYTFGDGTTAKLSVAGTLEASAGTGSINTAGGFYAAKAIISGSTTASTSTTTGALIVGGGAGFAKAINVGGTDTSTFSSNLVKLAGTGTNSTLLTGASSQEYGLTIENLATGSNDLTKILFATNRGSTRQLSGAIGVGTSNVAGGAMFFAVGDASHSYPTDLVATFAANGSGNGNQFYNTTEATTGGASSLGTLGGIYAAKAIISGSATASTSTTTGGGIFGGGVGIAGATWIGGLLNVTGTATFANTTLGLIVQPGSGNNNGNIQLRPSGSAVTASFTFTDSSGTGQASLTNLSGTLYDDASDHWFRISGNNRVHITNTTIDASLITGVATFGGQVKADSFWTSNAAPFISFNVGTGVAGSDTYIGRTSTTLNYEATGGHSMNISGTAFFNFSNAGGYRFNGTRMLLLPTAFSLSSWTTAGSLFRSDATTVTNSSTAASGTAASAVFNSFSAPVLAAANASVTTTDVATVYIEPATMGTNMTGTNIWGLWNTGKTRLDGVTGIGTGTASGRPTNSGLLIVYDIAGAGPASVGGIEFQDANSGSGYGNKIYTNASGDYLGIAGRFNSATWTEWMTLKQQTGNVNFASTTASTSTTTGALVVSGGAGFAKAINVGGTDTSVFGSTQREPLTATSSNATDTIFHITNTGAGGNDWQLRSVAAASGKISAGSLVFFDGTASTEFVYGGSINRWGGAVAAYINGVTTSTDGLIVGNYNTATAGATVQMSGRLRWQGTAWNSSGGGTAETNNFKAEVLPATAAGTTSSVWKLSAANSAISAGAYIDIFAVNSGVATLATAFVSSFSTLEATIGGAGSFTTLGGIYAAKKIIGASSFATGDPASGTAAAFKVGSFVAAEPSGPVGYLQFDSAGVAYQIPTGATSGVVFGSFAAQTAAVASVVALTVGASDASYNVSSNVNVTASTLHNFTVTCAYTDETNTSRTLTLTFSTLTGTFLTAITNAQGAGAYEGVPLQIRCKAGTSVTIATTGTFTTITYNVRGSLEQIN